jgi:hypothetical protein
MAPNISFEWLRSRVFCPVFEVVSHCKKPAVASVGGSAANGTRFKVEEFRIAGEAARREAQEQWQVGWRAGGMRAFEIGDLRFEKGRHGELRIMNCEWQVTRDRHSGPRPTAYFNCASLRIFPRSGLRCRSTLRHLYRRRAQNHAPAPGIDDIQPRRRLCAGPRRAFP